MCPHFLPDFSEFGVTDLQAMRFSGIVCFVKSVQWNQYLM